MDSSSKVAQFHLGMSEDGQRCLMVFIDEKQHAMECVADFSEFTTFISSLCEAANEMAKRVTDLAMQLHGGNGLTEEYGIERLHRDAHGWAVAGGTPTMQRIRIATELTGRRFDQRR